MHVKYYYLLKLIWHAINIKGWLQREMQQHTPAAVKRQQDGGNELVLVLGVCPEAASPDTGTKDTGAAPTASLSARRAVLHHNVVLVKWLQSPSHFSLLIFAADSASGMSARSLESLYSGL